MIESTIHCKNAAAEVLVEQLYTTLTNRPTYRLTPRSQSFNDLSYQVCYFFLLDCNHFELPYLNYHFDIIYFKASSEFAQWSHVFVFDHAIEKVVFQSKLPLHARATTSTAIKNNLANTELETGPDTNHLMNKTQSIISLHRQHRQNQRLQVRSRR